MKRTLFVLAAALAMIAGMVAVAAAYPATLSPVGQAGQGQRPLIGTRGGKIIAIKPPLPWDTSGPVDFSKPHLGFLPAGMPVFGTDVNVGPGNETSIASNPMNPLNFVAGANIGYRFTTTNGGQTWSTGSLSGGGDPAIAFDPAGRAYYAQLGSGACGSVYVYKSTDQGTSWTGPQIPLVDPDPVNHFFDKEWITVDNNPASPHRGRIYVTASNFYVPGCNLNSYVNVKEVLSYSDDQGATWSNPYTPVSDASHDQVQFTNPVAAPDGTVYVSYQYQNCTYNCTFSIPMYQMIARSTDGGVSFSPSITVTGQPMTPTGAFVGGYQYLYSSSQSGGFRHNDQEIIGVSPTNSNVVYSVWTDGRFDSTFVYQGVTGHHADIVFSRSTDGGLTWTNPAKVNDTPNGDGTDQFFPWMVVGTDGTIHVSWMDRRAGGFQYREYYTQSTDGGQTWAPNEPVADAGGTPSGFIGDYSGLAVNYDNSLVLPNWTDMRSGQRSYIDRGVLTQGTPTATVVVPTVTLVPPTQTATEVPSSTPAATETPGATGTPVEPTPCALSFTDVPSTDPFYVYIRCLACRGIVSGYSDGTFRPYNNITRGQISKVVSNAAAFSDPIPSDRQTYADVPGTDTFWEWIERLTVHGVMGGYECGGVGEPCDPQSRPYFRPYANATRAQLAKIDSNAAGYIEPATGQYFSDVSPAHPFYVWIQRLASRGIMSGYPCGGAGEPCDPENRPYFRPYNDVTRGQASKIVANTFYPNCVTPRK